MAAAHGLRRGDPSQPRAGCRSDPAGRPAGGRRASRPDLRPWRHRAGHGGALGRRARPLDPAARGRPLVWPRRRGQQGPARRQPDGAGGRAGRARRAPRLHPEAAAGDRGGDGVRRVAGVRGRTPGCPRRRHAAGQRRAAGAGGHAHAVHGHAGQLPLRLGGGPAARRRPFRQLGRHDAGPGHHPGPRHRRHRRPARAHPGAGLAAPTHPRPGARRPGRAATCRPRAVRPP